MIPDFESLATERLLLRRLRESDLDAVFAIHADPETNRYNPAGSMHSRDAAREQLEAWLEAWSLNGMGYWAVERREAPGMVVGFGGVRLKELEGQRVLNLAWRLTPRVWGCGYATEMARVALALARKHFPDIPLVAIIHPENAASIRVAERLGMRLDRVIQDKGIASGVYVVGESV